MAKLTITDFTSLGNPDTFITELNTAFGLVETAIENTLSRDGTTPNGMGYDLDFNSHSALNVNDIDFSATAELVTTTNVITAGESGKTFFLDSTTAFVSTLPTVSLGLNYKFILKQVPSATAHTIVTNSSANIIVGQQHCANASAGDTGSTDDTISFVTGQTVAGDMVEVRCDGTKWHAMAFSRVAAGITFTTAS